MVDVVVHRFHSLQWHDSKLMGLSFGRVGTEDWAKLEVHFIGAGNAFTPSEVIFDGSTYIQISVDLDGKRECSDHIAGAQCHVSSDFLRQLTADNPYDNFGGYLHFEIEMIHPGGIINVLAKDFTIRALTE